MLRHTVQAEDMLGISVEYKTIQIQGDLRDVWDEYL